MAASAAPALPASDERADRAFAAWFSALPPDPALIRFFERSKDCITAHGPDAVFIAREFYGTASVLKQAGGLPAVALTRATYAAALRTLLLDRGSHRVQLFEPVAGGGGAGSAPAWRKAKEGSPGRPGGFEAELYRNADAPDAPPLLAVVVSAPGAGCATTGGRRVGFALVDAARRELAATEFGDDDEAFGALEAAAAAAGVREAVLQAAPGREASPGPGGADGTTPGPPAAAAAHARARAALERAGALVSDGPRSAFATKELEADLGRLLRSRSVEQHRDVLDRPLACAALAGALSFAEVGSDAGGLGRWGLRLHDTGAALRLDAAALAALGVVPDRPGVGGAAAALGGGATAAATAGAATSLTALLAVGRTPMGRRTAAAWLRAPLVDLGAITARHDVVEALTADAGLRAALRDSLLRGLPDIDRLARKLERRAASLADLCALYRAAARLGPLVSALRGYDPAGAPAGGRDHAPLLASWFADPLARACDADHLGKYEDLIEAALDLDRVPDEYLVSAAYDEGLRVLRGEKDAAEAGVASAASAAASDLGLTMDKGVKLEWFKPGGGGGGGGGGGARVRCLRVTAAEERRVRSKLSKPGFTLLETRKDGTKFTCRALRSAADALAAADAAYAKRQACLADQVVGVASTFCDVWANVARLLGELDALAGFAAAGAAAPLPYVRPAMTPADGGLLALRGLRHPVVEALAGVDFVPNDAVLVKRGSAGAPAEAADPHAAWFAVVTGPNMGGKSTFIRSVGLAVVMAQAGCFVPASSATLPVRDAVFARVGAGDCQARGVSTFMAEMLETASILRGASPASLVIVDELGRGTSTYDGFGLAWAISEHLMAAVGCPTLFATHFHELTALDGPGGVANWHVETAVEGGGGGGGGGAPRGSSDGGPPSSAAAAAAKKKLTMLYRVAPGPCDQSFGIHVAEVAGFPPCVIEAARARAAALEDFAGRPGGGGDQQPPAKKARPATEDEGEAGARARAFLTALAGLEGEGGAAVAAAAALVDGLAADAAGNPALKALVA